MESNKKADPSVCVHCHKCRSHCGFLSKYEIDIGDVEQLQNLAFHCFLCGTCSRVCPVGIDGRQAILDMRREAVRRQSGRPPGDGYETLLKEKLHYQFANDQSRGSRTVLFPGCSFPSYYPETTRFLAELLRREAGIGTIFDCCGKPIAELGLEEDEERIIRELDEKMEREDIEEVVMICPNCYQFLQGRMKTRITTIYQKLTQLGIGRKLEGMCRVYLPCPDREEQVFLSTLKPFLSREPEIAGDVQCCGLGGCARVREPALAQEMLSPLESWDEIHTYCASCCGAFTRKGGVRVRHFLVEILKTEETADGTNGLRNRSKFQYWKEKN